MKEIKNKLVDEELENVTGGKNFIQEPDEGRLIREWDRTLPYPDYQKGYADPNENTL